MYSTVFGSCAKPLADVILALIALGIIVLILFLTALGIYVSNKEA